MSGNTDVSTFLGEREFETTDGDVMARDFIADVLNCLTSASDGVCLPQCAVNGVCYEQLADEGRYVLSLEIFFSGFPRMVGLSSFPCLCQLTIVGQSVRLLEGLDRCPLLRELWVVQCQLTVRQGRGWGLLGRLRAL